MRTIFVTAVAALLLVSTKTDAVPMPTLDEYARLRPEPVPLPILHTTMEVKKVPAAWPMAPDITKYCGAYQMQAVLAAHGRKFAVDDLYDSEAARESTSTLPWDVDLILEERAEIQTRSHYFFGDEGLLEIIRHSLRHGRPLLVSIYATRGHHGLHWISIWGYNADRNMLEVYDSQYATRKGGDGNTAYTPQQLEDQLPPWPLHFAVEIMN